MNIFNPVCIRLTHRLEKIQNTFKLVLQFYVLYSSTPRTSVHFPVQPFDFTHTISQLLVAYTIMIMTCLMSELGYY